MAAAASGATVASPQQWGCSSSPAPAASGIPQEYAIPRLLQSLVPPALAKWMRAEVDAGHCEARVAEGDPAHADAADGSSWRGSFGTFSHGDNEDDITSGINPLFPLAGAVDAQLSRLGGEAWEALRASGKTERLGSPSAAIENFKEDGELSGISNDAEQQLSLGESRALLQALLPLAAHRFCAAVSSDQQQQQQQSDANSHPVSGVFSVIPQPSEAAADEPQQWLGASQKAGGPLTCGPLLGGPFGAATSGLSSGLHPNSEVQRRRLRRRRQTLLRQLLKSRAVLLQLSQQPEAGAGAAATAAEAREAAGETDQRQVLRQRIGSELRRAAITAYNLSCCCQEERRQSGVVHGETAYLEGATVKEETHSAPHQTGPPASAVAALYSEHQQAASTASSSTVRDKISACSPELLLPLAALPCEVGGGGAGTEGDTGDPEGSSPPPPPSPVSWPQRSPSEDDSESGAPEGRLAEGGGSSTEVFWALEEIAFDGRRSAFVVTLLQRGLHKESSLAAAEQSRRPPRRIKVFYCLCRSRDKTAAVAARYAELRQRICLSPDEAEAAQTLSDEGETDEESDAAVSAPSAREKEALKGSKGICRLLQEVGEGLELLQLRRQRQALQQQRLRLFDAASQGCWFAANTIVTGAPYPLSDPPWRYRLAPVPPGVQLSEGPPDVSEELSTPNSASGTAAVSCLQVKAAAQKVKGASKFRAPVGAPVQCGGQLDGSNPYAGAEEEDSSTQLLGGRKGSSSSVPAATAADGESGAPFPVLSSDVEELPFVGDPPDAKPWPRPPVSRAPYTCFSVEAPIGGGVSGGILGHMERMADNPTPDAESAETSWADPTCEVTAEDSTLATAGASGDGSVADAGAAGSKVGEAVGMTKAGVAPGGMGWALRVSQRQKGDSWQLRMAAALLTRGFEEMRESPGERDGGGNPSVDFLLLYDSQEHRDAALKTLQGLQPPTPTSFTVAVDSERRKELRQIYDLFLEPTFAVQADDKVVRIRDAVVNIFTYPQLYIMWFAEPADSETVSYLLNLAHTFFDRLGAAAADTGARELPADDSSLLQKNRLLLQLYMAQDQKETAAAAGGQPGALQEGGIGVANSPACGAAAATPRPPGTSVGGGGALVASPLGASPPGAPSATAGGYKEEVLQVAGVGPVDFTLPDGVKFDKSKLAFRCLWREGSAPIRLQQQQQQQQLQQQGMASPKTPAASGPPRWQGASPAVGGSLLKSQSSQQQNRSRTFSCRKYGLYQSKLLAMQARLASELLVPQPPATTRNRIAALPAVVFGLLPLPEPVESAQQAVEGIPVAERDRQTRRVNWQQLLQQGGWKGGCTDAAFAEAAADAVEALVGDNPGHSRPSNKRKRHTGAPQRSASSLQQQQQEAAQTAASIRSSRPSEEPTLVSPADAAAAWSLTPGSRPGAGGPQAAPQGPLDSPAAWVVQAGDGTDERVMQQQALSSRALLACVWEHAACRWRVALAAGPEEAGGGPGGGVVLGRSCFFFSPSEPGRKKAALLLARRWAACQLLRGERLCVLARPVLGTESALEFLQSCPGLWTAEDEADVNTLPFLSPQQLRSVAVSCESAGAAGFAAAAPETGLNTCSTTPSTFDCSPGFGGGAPLTRLAATDGGAPLQLSADSLVASGGWCDWQSPQNAVGTPFTPMGGARPPWGPPLAEGSTAEGGPPAKKAKSRSRPTKQSVPMDEAAAERLRSQKAAAARVRWMRYRMQQEAEAQQLTAALAATLTDRPHMPDNNLNPLTAIFPM